jgi:hypothetical protein
MKITLTDKILLIKSIVIMLWGTGVTYLAGTNFELFKLNEPLPDAICKTIYIIVALLQLSVCSCQLTPLNSFVNKRG